MKHRSLLFCLATTLVAASAAAQGPPSSPEIDFGSASSAEAASIKQACAAYWGAVDPDAYYSCLRRKLSELRKSGGPPSFTYIPDSETPAIKHACDAYWRGVGPGAYYSCLRRKLSDLQKSGGPPSFTDISDSETEVIKHACNAYWGSEGPGAYYSCLRRTLSALQNSSGPPREKVLPDSSNDSHSRRLLGDATGANATDQVTLPGTASSESPPTQQPSPPRPPTPIASRATPAVSSEATVASGAFWLLVVAAAIAVLFSTKFLFFRSDGMQPRICPTCRAVIFSSDNVCALCRAAETARQQEKERSEEAERQRADAERRARDEREKAERQRAEAERRAYEEAERRSAQERARREAGEAQRRAEAARQAQEEERTRQEQRGGETGDSHRGPQTESSHLDPYEILGINRAASGADIRAAYKREVLKYHPDRLSHFGAEFKAIAEEKMRQINRAFEMLSEE